MTWETVPLGEVARFVRGVTYKPADVVSDSEGGTACLRTKNIQSTLDLSDLVYIRSNVRHRPEQRVRRNDVLVSSANSWHLVGKAAQAGADAEGMLIGGFIGGLRFAPTHVDPRYGYYWFSSPTVQGTVRSFGQQTTNISNLNVDRTLRLPLPLPPLAEQRRIAAILDEADALRSRARRAMQHRSELVSEEFIRRFASRDLRHVPVAELVASAPGAIRTGPFGSDLLHSEFVDEGVPVLGIDNVVSNDFTWARPRHITPSKYESLRRYTVQPRDVLISIMGTVGRCAVAPDDIGVAINTKHLCCISLDRTKCEPRFLQSYFLHHPVARDYLRRTSKGAIMDGLNMGIIKALPVALPSIEDQRDYLEWSGRAKSMKLEPRAAQLDTLFASLQHRAFRGEL